MESSSDVSYKGFREVGERRLPVKVPSEAAQPCQSWAQWGHQCCAVLRQPVTGHEHPRSNRGGCCSFIRQCTLCAHPGRTGEAKVSGREPTQPSSLANQRPEGGCCLSPAVERGLLCDARHAAGHAQPFTSLAGAVLGGDDLDKQPQFTLSKITTKVDKQALCQRAASSQLSPLGQITRLTHSTANL